MILSVGAKIIIPTWIVNIKYQGLEMFVLVVMKAAELNTSAAGKHAEKVWLGKHLMPRTATKSNKK